MGGRAAGCGAFRSLVTYRDPMTRPGSGSGPDDGLVPGPPAGRFATVAEWVAQLNGEPRHAAPDEQPPARHLLPGTAEEHLGRADGHGVPGWDHLRYASDDEPRPRLNGHHRAPDDAEAAEWVREWPRSGPSNGHPAAGTDQPWSRGSADGDEPAWDDQPPRTWESNGHPAAGAGRPWSGGPWVEEPRPWLDGHLDRPEWGRGPAAPRPHPRGRESTGAEPDTLSGWDALRYSPPPAAPEWPANGHVQPPDERPGAASAFAPDPGTRWGDVPLPGAPPAPPRPETTPAAGPPPVPGAVPPGADSTQLLHRYVPAREVLDREDREPPTRRPPALPTHPPRAVVRRRRARRRLLEWPFLIVFALLSAYFIRAYVVQTFYIPSGSMHETLLEGDRVLVNKVGYHLHEVHRGDVVVFRRPPDFPVEDEDLIKRVVALPGETVEGRGRQIYVDGRPLTEPYVQPECSGTEDFPRITVPRDKLWVMGDNRCNSSDSRVFGPVGEDLLVGRAFVVAWPFARLSWL